MALFATEKTDRDLDNLFSNKVHELRYIAGRLDEVEEERAELEAKVQRIRMMWDELHRRRQKLEDDLAELRPAREERQRPRACPFTDEEWRDALVSLGRFTPPELAGRLHVDAKRVKPKLKEAEAQGIVRAVGRFAGNVMYEYVAPTEAGRAFEQQRKLTTAEEDVATEAVDRSGEVSGTSVKGRLPADLWEVVRHAKANGWEFRPHGGPRGHSLLVRGNCRVTVVTTPRNASEAAKQLRARLRNAR